MVSRGWRDLLPGGFRRKRANPNLRDLRGLPWVACGVPARIARQNLPLWRRRTSAAAIFRATIGLATLARELLCPPRDHPMQHFFLSLIDQVLAATHAAKGAAAGEVGTTPSAGFAKLVNEALMEEPSGAAPVFPQPATPGAPWPPRSLASAASPSADVADKAGQLVSTHDRPAPAVQPPVGRSSSVGVPRPSAPLPSATVPGLDIPRKPAVVVPRPAAEPLSPAGLGRAAAPTGSVPAGMPVQVRIGAPATARPQPVEVVAATAEAIDAGSGAASHKVPAERAVAATDSPLTGMPVQVRIGAPTTARPQPAEVVASAAEAIDAGSGVAPHKVPAERAVAAPGLAAQGKPGATHAMRPTAESEAQGRMPSAGSDALRPAARS